MNAEATRQRRSIQRRLLPPLLVLLLLLLVVFWFALQALNRQHVELESQLQSDSVVADFQLLRNERVDAMALAMQAFLFMDPQLVEYLEARNRDGLLRDYQPAWNLLKDYIGVTHFYFHLPDRRNLLRMHEPELHGDLIERDSLVRADRTWAAVNDIDYGATGTLTLRAVQPVYPVVPEYRPQQRAGFLELGIELEHLLEDLRARLSPDQSFEYLVLVPRSTAPNARTASAGGSPASDSLVPTIASLDFPRSLVGPVLQRLQDASAPWGVDVPVEIELDGRHWLTSRIEIDPARPELILLTAQDISALYRIVRTITWTAYSGAALLCALLLAGFYQALRRLNTVLDTQQEALSETTERLDLALSVANDGIWDWFLADNRVVFDDRYYTLAGYEAGEFPSRYEEFAKRVHPEDFPRVRTAIDDHLAGRSNLFTAEFRFLNADGRYMWIRGRGNIVERDATGRPLRFIGTHSDITDLKLAEFEAEGNAKQLDKRNRLLESINRLGRAVTAANSIEEIGRLTVSVLREQDGAPLVGLFLVDRDEPEHLYLTYYDTIRVNEPLFRAAAKLPIADSFNGMALSQRRILHCADFETDERINTAVQQTFLRAGARAETILPLIYRDRPIGTIAIVYLDYLEYTEEDRWAHNAVAQTVSIAIDNLLNMQELRRRQLTAESLNELSLELNRAETVEDLAKRTLATLRNNQKGTRGVFYLITEDGDEVEMLASDGFREQETADFLRMSIAGTWTGAAIAERRVKVTGDATEEPLINETVRERFRAMGVRGVACLPLVYQNQVLGCVNLLFDRVQQFDEGQLMAFDSMARTVSFALHGAQNTAELRFQANHDTLTGLPNRQTLHEHFAELLKRPSPPGSLVMLLLDLNRFKEVNDTLGHHIGDELLRAMGERVSPLARVHDGILFRLGGDEFAIVAEARDAGRIADSVAAGLRHPFALGGMNLELDCSIGAALYPDHGSDSHELLRCADIAMYAAKQSNDTFRMYQQEFDDKNPQRLEMLSALRGALADDCLQLVYQPRIEIASRQLTSCEALLRWQHPSLGAVSPAEFVPLAEMTDVIHSLTPWVIRRALLQLRAWRNQGLHTRVSINVSGRNLLDVEFPQRVELLLEECGVPARQLEFEITETALVTDPDRALTVLRTLSGLGISIAIDDFGTGYSSLDYLKRLPLHALKVDRSFIKDMLDYERDAAIVKSTIGLAHSLGLRVVAEGAEDAPTIERLRELGCEEVQGYYFSKPLPPDAFLEWARQYGRDYQI